MKFDLEIYEIYEILRDGTTNQQQFVENIRDEDLETSINFFNEIAEEIGINDCFRGAINGGALTIIDDDEEIDEEPFRVTLSDGRILIFDYRLY